MSLHDREAPAEPSERSVAQPPRRSSRDGFFFGSWLSTSSKERFGFAIGQAVLEQLIELRTAQVARRLEHLVQRRARVARQAQPERGQDRGVFVGEALRHLDLR